MSLKPEFVGVAATSRHSFWPALACLVLLLGATLAVAVEPTKMPAPVVVGETVTEAITVDYPATPQKGVLWERRFTSEGASYVAIHFTEYSLAPGDYVEISNADGSHTVRLGSDGKLVRKGESALSTFWATHIPGDTAIVRLVSSGTAIGSGFAIDQWAHGFPADTLNKLLGEQSAMLPEAICGADDKEWAPCYAGTEMYIKSRAVARLLVNGIGACTGWLLGSEGHLMTNNHCINSQTIADNTDYEFMAEGATCNTGCTGWFSCPGTVEASSGTLVKTNYQLDYSLIQLPTNLTGEYGYLQLRETLPVTGEQIYIPQHPGGKGKQLGVLDSTEGGYCNVATTNAPPCIGGPGDIGYYCDTEGGSSGSPVLASDDNLVVALHHCAYCPNRGVPIPAIIAHLGADLPLDAIGGSQNGPQPDITANDSKGPVDVAEGDSVSVKVSLSPGAGLGVPADWWVMCNVDELGGWYYYTHHPAGGWWTAGQGVAAQAALFDLSPPMEVLNHVLPAGKTTCYFGVDGNVNGVLDDPLFYDSVEINVSSVPSSCKAPSYNASFWNDQGLIQQNNNCYNYANDKVTYTFAQPGKFCGDYPYPMSCSEVKAAAQCDGLVPSSATDACPEGTHKVYLVVWPGEDYHWYRLDQGAGGKWSHKPGSTEVRDYDAQGKTIYDPTTADVHPYTERCGYMCACGGEVATIELEDTEQ